MQTLDSVAVSLGYVSCLLFQGNPLTSDIIHTWEKNILISASTFCIHPYLVLHRWHSLSYFCEVSALMTDVLCQYIILLQEEATKSVLD